MDGRVDSPGGEAVNLFAVKGDNMYIYICIYIL